MKISINEVIIDGTVFVPKDSAGTLNYTNAEGLPYVLVRTYSAGVYTGFLASKEGKEVKLLNAIMIWKWDGAFTLSQLAMEGTSKPNNCQFAIPVPVIDLIEAIAIIPVTEKAYNSLTGVVPCRK